MSFQEALYSLASNEANARGNLNITSLFGYENRVSYPNTNSVMIHAGTSNSSNPSCIAIGH